MNAQYNVNKHVQQLEAQVTELGKATELTWGPAGSKYEGPMCNPRPSHWGRSEATTQVTDLGTATELTLGGGLGNHEGGKPLTRSWKTELVSTLGSATKLTLGQAGPNWEGSMFRPVRG